MAAKRSPERRPNGHAGEDHLYLLNRVSLDDHLSFMRSYPVDAEKLDRKQIAEEWRAAHKLMERLRQSEPTWCDRPAIEPLPKQMQALVDNVTNEPIFAKAFSDAPVEFGMVELDRLVVSQKLVTADHLPRLIEKLGPSPTPEALFRFCLPYERPTPEWRGGRVDDEMFAFTSASSDLRFLDSVLLKPEQISGYQATGPVAAVVGLVVGFGSNYLNAVKAGNRLVLNNGHHRACALRKAGITHAPIAIQTATNRDELDVLAPRAVRRDPELYLEAPRPPALKDYFDDRLSRHVRLAMSTRQITVSFSTDDKDMP